MADTNLEQAEYTIVFNQLTRKFGNTHAVDRLSFKVRPGEVFGFIGPNGAGKTTSMRILATLDMPTHGEAWVDGFSVIDDPDRVRHRLGWMPDGFGTYPYVNCDEYLDFFARSYGLRGNERRAALTRVMGFTQLDRLANKPIKGLSKGMKQRLCLGRALIHDPAVLVLDEPAAGLDPRARIELREMIAELADQGKSLLVSSHILTELAEMCDRVGIIELGKLLAVGTVDEILNRDRPAQQAESRNIQLSVLSDPQVAREWLEQKEEINIRRVVINDIEFEFQGDDQQQSVLLKEILEAGIEVLSFSSKRQSLEDAFLSVTRGQVQ
ncbi:MAG: ABC transporter ATP-binding protein [Planctomycetota bacterium]